MWVLESHLSGWLSVCVRLASAWTIGRIFYLLSVFKSIKQGPLRSVTKHKISIFRKQLLHFWLNMSHLWRPFPRLERIRSMLRKIRVRPPAPKRVYEKVCPVPCTDSFRLKGSQSHSQPRTWRISPCGLIATVYSTYSQLLHICWLSYISSTLSTSKQNRNFFVMYVLK
jgi:hypothetical protein